MARGGHEKKLRFANATNRTHQITTTSADQEQKSFFNSANLEEIESGRSRNFAESEVLDLRVGGEQLIGAQHIPSSLGLPDHLQGEELIRGHRSKDP